MGSYLRQVGGFIRVLRFPPSIKLAVIDDITELTEITLTQLLE
jgi:hypothetical protein